jgi:hypothetical protein
MDCAASSVFDGARSLPLLLLSDEDEDGYKGHWPRPRKKEESSLSAPMVSDGSTSVSTDSFFSRFLFRLKLRMNNELERTLFLKCGRGWKQHVSDSFKARITIQNCFMVLFLCRSVQNSNALGQLKWCQLMDEFLLPSSTVTEMFRHPRSPYIQYFGASNATDRVYTVPGTAPTIRHASKTLSE